MSIPQSLIDQIQNRVDIVEVISKFLPLKKAGRNYKGNCPFHEEKTPSFVVSPDKQIYHCFGCGSGGNVFSFVMKYENVEFPEAVEMLAEQAGIQLPSNFSGERSVENAFAQKLYEINEIAAQFFQVCLTNSQVGRKYFESRGINEATLKSFRLGFAPEGWEALLNFLKKKGIDGATAEKAGLAIANGKGGHYDRFRNRAIFPIFDLKGRVLGFGGRVLDSGMPKYMNSPETAIYSKGKNLYGLNAAREHIKKAGHVLIVEGYFDCIVPSQTGVGNIIATLGTALTIDQVKLLKRFAQTAVMVYDPDAAGENATLRNLDIFINEDVNVYVAELREGLDPDSFIRKFGLEEFRAMIKASKNLFDYKLDKLSERNDIKSMYGKMQIASDMLPTINRINNAILRSSLVKKLAEKLCVEEAALREELGKVKSDHPASHAPAAVRKAVFNKDNNQSAEKMMIALLLDSPAFIETMRERLNLDELKSTTIREITQAILKLHDETGSVSPAMLINSLGAGSEASLMISEAVNVAEMLIDKEKVMVDCITRIKQNNVKDRLRRLQDEIQMAYNSKQEERIRSLMTEYDSLMKTKVV